MLVALSREPIITSVYQFHDFSVPLPGFRSEPDISSIPSSNYFFCFQFQSKFQSRISVPFQVPVQQGTEKVPETGTRTWYQIHSQVQKPGKCTWFTRSIPEKLNTIVIFFSKKPEKRPETGSWTWYQVLVPVRNGPGKKTWLTRFFNRSNPFFQFHY